MADNYIKSRDEALLAAFCAGFANAIGPSIGSASGESDGVAYPAKGDPSFYYACIRSPEPFDLPTGIEHASIDDGVSVVGVFWDEA